MPTAENNQKEQENQRENCGVLKLHHEKEQTMITPMRMRLPDLMVSEKVRHKRVCTVGSCLYDV